jgi:hypothetical protein
MSSVCKKCGVEHLTRLGYPACKAHTKRGACRANPVRGATVCSKHGLTGAVKRKAAERVAAEKVERTMGDLMRQHDRPDEHPFAALLDASRRHSAMSRALEEMVTEYRASGHDDHVQAAVGLYERISRLSAQTSKTVLDANIEQRLVQIEEQKIEAFYELMLVGLRAIDATPEQESAFRAAAAGHLRAYQDGRKPLPAVPETHNYRPPHMDR